jgi:hypothetical protein
LLPASLAVAGFRLKTIMGMIKKRDNSKGKSEIRGFWLRQNDGQKAKADPPAARKDDNKK